MIKNYSQVSKSPTTLDGDFPDILSKEEEYELALDLFENNNLEAAKKLVVSHIRFVSHIAKEYKGYGLENNDLIQEGTVGLMKAVKKFNPHKNVRLSTFSVYWIRAQIHEFIFKNWKIVRLATTKAQRKIFFKMNKLRSGMSESLNSQQIKAIAVDLDVSEKDIIEMEYRLKFQNVLEDDKDSGSIEDNGFQLIDLYAKTPEQMLIESRTLEENNGKMFEVLSELSEKEKDIIQSRFLSECKITLKDLSKKYCVSIEAVRKQELKIIDKIKNKLKNK